MSFKPNNTGFSFVELLISMLLVAVLYAVVFAPSAEKVRQKKFADCAERLKKLHLSLNLYATEHDGQFPHIAGSSSSGQPLGLLVPKYTSDTSVFVCPAAGISVPSQGKPLADSEISYAYATGLNQRVPSSTPIVSDILASPKAPEAQPFSTDGKGPAKNHERFGGNVLFVDGHVEQLAPTAAGRLKLPAHAVWLNPKL